MLPPIFCVRVEIRPDLCACFGLFFQASRRAGLYSFSFFQTYSAGYKVRL
jgi:hypothetical protein